MTEKRVFRQPLKFAQRKNPTFNSWVFNKLSYCYLAKKMPMVKEIITKILKIMLAQERKAKNAISNPITMEAAMPMAKISCINFFFLITTLLLSITT